MNQTADPADILPPEMGQIVLKATEEILGREGASAVLGQAQLQHLAAGLQAGDHRVQLTFQDLGKLQVGLEAAYGPRSGRGLALRAGRVCFKYGLQEFGAHTGLRSLAFSLLPVDQKLRVGLDLIAEMLNQDADHGLRIEEQENVFLWHFERCPVCSGRVSDAPVCSLVVGFLQESLYWISGGKHFNVEEIACTARGDPACTLQVDKHPLD